MSLISIVFINVLVTSSSVASDHQRDNMMTVLRALRDLGNVRHDTESSRHILSGIWSNLNSRVDSKLEPATIYIDNHLNSKSKRGWEDFSKEWRRSPKRAWDVVRRLWKVPEIRTKYITFLKNGKRSDEILVNTPVQDSNAIPEMVLNEVRFGEMGDADTEHERKEMAQELMKYLVQSGTKRGWEDINIFKTRTLKRRLAAVGDRLAKKRENKRGWEDLLWKRNVGGLSKHEDYVANILSEIDNAKIDIVNIRPFDRVTLPNTDRSDEQMFEYTNAPVFVLQ